MERRIFTLIILVLLVSTSILSASELVSITCTRDNVIIQKADGSLGNSTGQIFAGRTNQDVGTPVMSIRRGLIYFDISTNIPANAIIDSVRLSMYFSRTSGDGTEVTLHKVLSNWGEGTSYFNGGQGAAATPNDATWLYSFFNTVSWKTAGGDFDPSMSATSYIGVESDYGIKTWASSTMKDDVQAWLMSPTTNFGWLLQGDESSGHTSKQFLSRENGNPAYCPILNVYYSVPTNANIINDSNTVFTLFPNHANNTITVSLNNVKSDKIIIYNLFGEEYKSVDVAYQKEIHIDVSNYSAGLYFVKIGTQTSRLLIVH